MGHPCYTESCNDNTNQIHDETAHQPRSAFEIGLSVLFTKFRFTFSRALTRVGPLPLPYGLIVFTDADADSRQLPEEWQKVLDQRNFLHMAPQGAGNDQHRCSKIYERLRVGADTFFPTRQNPKHPWGRKVRTNVGTICEQNTEKRGKTTANQFRSFLQGRASANLKMPAKPVEHTPNCASTNPVNASSNSIGLKPSSCGQKTTRDFSLRKGHAMRKRKNCKSRPCTTLEIFYYTGLVAYHSSRLVAYWVAAPSESTHCGVLSSDS